MSNQNELENEKIITLNGLSVFKDELDKLIGKIPEGSSATSIVELIDEKIGESEEEITAEMVLEWYGEAKVLVDGVGIVSSSTFRIPVKASGYKITEVK